jgi:threonine/homoserine/homoserine lactone efflux protein
MEALLPFLGFAVVATTTPGPNNLMVLTSGANFGVLRTIPHIVGIAIGFPILVLVVGLGVGMVFEAYPVVHTILKYVAFAYLLWLAWQIARSERPDAKGARPHPLTFLQAVAFQWVNPKAWAMILGAMALFTASDGSSHVLQVAVMALIFGVLCLPNGVVWALFGRAIAGFLADDRQRFWFNVVMAVLLVVSSVPSLFEHAPA